MSRRPEAAAEQHTQPGEDGEGERFLDALPGTDGPDDDEDNDGDEDDEGDDEDDDDPSGEGEPLPNAASASPKPTTVRRRAVDRVAAAPNVPPASDSPPSGAPLRVPARPRGIQGPRSLTPSQREASGALQQARKFQESAYQEIDSLLAGLNFSSREYEVRVSRYEPEVDEDGVPCVGHLHTYKDKVTVDDICRRFKGGKYELKIYGPHPTTGRLGIIKTERFTVAGYPAPMAKQGRTRDRDESNATGEVLRAITDANERAMQRLTDVMESTKGNSAGIVSEILPAITPLIERFLSKNEESTRLMLAQQQEERRREDERRTDERRTEESRRRDEEERRREEREREREERKAEEERRHEEARRTDDERRERQREERERLKEEREIERERQREERDRLREETRAELAEKQRQHERDMQMQSERTKADQQYNQQMMQMMQNYSAQNIEILQARMEGGGVKAVTEQLLMLNQLKGELSGDNQEPTNFEKFTEGLDNVVKTVVPGLSQVMQAARGGQRQQTQQVTARVQNPGQPMGRPIVVDLGPQRTALPPQAAQQQQPQQVPQPQQNPGTPPAVTGTPPEQAQTDIIKNDYTAFAFPTSNDDMITAGMMLLKDVDLAVQKNLTAEQIVEQVLDPFEASAPFLTSMASGLTTEMMIDFIQSNVPSRDWAILTPRGEELVSQAFEMWRDAGAEGEEG